MCAWLRCDKGGVGTSEFPYNVLDAQWDTMPYTQKMLSQYGGTGVWTMFSLTPKLNANCILVGTIGMNDGLRPKLEASVDGNTWTTLISNVAHDTAITVSLSQFANQKILLRFTIVNNESYQVGIGPMRTTHTLNIID